MCHTNWAICENGSYVRSCEAAGNTAGSYASPTGTVRVSFDQVAGPASGEYRRMEPMFFNRGSRRVNVEEEQGVPCGGYAGGDLITFDELAACERRARADERDQAGSVDGHQRACVDSMSLNAMASLAARDGGPLVILVPDGGEGGFGSHRRTGITCWLPPIKRALLSC